MEKTRIVKVDLQVRFAGPMTLKDKRSRVSPIVSKIRATYQCAAMEVGTGNRSDRFDLVCVLIAASADDARSRVDTLIEYLGRCFRSDEWIETNIEWLE